MQFSIIYRFICTSRNVAGEGGGGACHVLTRARERVPPLPEDHVPGCDCTCTRVQCTQSYVRVHVALGIVRKPTLWGLWLQNTPAHMTLAGLTGACQEGG